MHRRAVPLRNECLSSVALAAALTRRSRLPPVPRRCRGLTESVTAHAVSQQHRDQCMGIVTARAVSWQHRDQSGGVGPQRGPVFS